MKRVYSEIKALPCCASQITFYSFINKVERRVLLAFIIGGLLMGATGTVQAQSAGTTETKATWGPAKAGTYQIITNSRKGDHEVTLTEQQLILIERLRKDNEVVCAQSPYSDDLHIKILPRNVINSPNFKPVPLKYYKDEEKYEEFHYFRYVEFQ